MIKCCNRNFVWKANCMLFWIHKNKTGLYRVWISYTYLIQEWPWRLWVVKESSTSAVVCQSILIHVSVSPNDMVMPYIKVNWSYRTNKLFNTNQKHISLEFNHYYHTHVTFVNTYERKNFCNLFYTCFIINFNASLLQEKISQAY